MTNWLTARRSTELSHGGRFYKHMEVHILIFDWFWLATESGPIPLFFAIFIEKNVFFIVFS